MWTENRISDEGVRDVVGFTRDPCDSKAEVQKFFSIRVVKQTPDPGAEDAKPVILIPVGLPCLERGRLYKKKFFSDPDQALVV